MVSVARILARRGHQVEMAVDSLRPGDLRERLRALGFNLRLDLTLSTKAGPVAWLRDAAALRRAARDLDVVHAHFSNDHALALLALRGRRQARVVRTVHSSRSLRDRPLQGVAHRRADGLIAVCQAHARLLVERFRVDPRRVLASRGAVDPVAFSPDGPDLRAELGLAPGQPAAGIVSRVKPDRRHAELIDAFALVARRLPEARLVVVGRGEGLEEIRLRAAGAGLERQVIFAGYRTGSELAAAYRTLDCKVLLAEGNDGTCRALLEAMACGRPGVAYRFGAPAETVADGRTGRLVPEGDVPALAGALLDLLRDPAGARALGAAARAQVVERNGEEGRALEVESFLERVRALPPSGV
jgi:glycosyltransferase involved in cell wall biosynthesis